MTTTTMHRLVVIKEFLPYTQRSCNLPVFFTIAIVLLAVVDSDDGLTVTKATIKTKTHLHTSFSGQQVGQQLPDPSLSTLPMKNATDIVNGSTVLPMCEAFAVAFADAAAEYTRCFITNARPMSLCVKCVEEYLRVRQSYEDLRTQVEDDPLDYALSQKRCENWILNADRIMAIQHTREFFENLWTSSQCPNCFESYTPPKVASFVLTFRELANATQMCFQNISLHMPGISSGNMSKVCTNCATVYKNLTNYYTSLTDSYKDKLCMDVVDTMNNTRRQWGHVYNCSGNIPQDAITITITVLFFILPTVFYITSKLHYQRDKQKIVKPNRMHPSASTASMSRISSQTRMLHPVSRSNGDLAALHT